MDIFNFDLSCMDDDQWIEIGGEDKIITFLKKWKGELKHILDEFSNPDPYIYYLSRPNLIIDCLSNDRSINFYLPKPKLEICAVCLKDNNYGYYPTLKWMKCYTCGKSICSKKHFVTHLVTLHKEEVKKKVLTWRRSQIEKL